MTVPNSISAQLTICWDGVSLKVEAPGRNGMRQKVEGILFDDLPIEIRHNLIAQIEAARDRQRDELMAVQRENIAYVANSPGMGIGFARQIWKDKNISSRTIRARLAKAGQFDPIRQKIVSNKPEKEILDLDLDL